MALETNSDTHLNHRPAVFSLNLDTPHALYAAYMPWLKQGGIFIPTRRELQLGSMVILRLQLPDETKPHMVLGSVVWINPSNISGGRIQGVGIHFSDAEEAKRLRALIETKLGALLRSGKMTHTL